jgi:hypothetical protein
MARKTKTEIKTETKTEVAPPVPTPPPQAAPTKGKAKASTKPIPKNAGRKVAEAAGKRSKVPSTAPATPKKRVINGHQVQLPAPQSVPAPAAEPPAAVAPSTLAPASDGFREVKSTGLARTLMQLERPCEVCGKPLTFGEEVFGRVATMTDGTMMRGDFQPRCLEHGPDLTAPIVAGAPAEKTPQEREWEAVQDESELINEAIQGAMSVLPPPENPPRRAAAIYICFLSGAAHAALEMGIDYEHAIENFADHYGEILEQRRRATQQDENASPA